MTKFSICTVALLLGSIGIPERDGARTKISGYLDHPINQHEFRAKSQGPDVTKLVQTLSTSRDENQRVAAAHALGQVALIFGSNTVVEAIPALLDAASSDQSQAVRSEANTALTSIGTNKSAVAGYLRAITSARTRGASGRARGVVIHFIETSNAEDIADLRVVEQLSPYWSSQVPIGRDSDRFNSFNGVVFIYRQLAVKSPSDRPAIINDSRRMLEWYASNTSDDRFPYGGVMGNLAASGSEGVKALLDVTESLPFTNRMIALVALNDVWLSLPNSAVIANREATLALAMEFVNRFPDQWNCDYARALPILQKLGPFAAPAAPKLRLLAALSERDAANRYRFPVCGQIEARNALEAM